MNKSRLFLNICSDCIKTAQHHLEEALQRMKPKVCNQTQQPTITEVTVSVEMNDAGQSNIHWILFLRPFHSNSFISPKIFFREREKFHP